MKLRKAPELMSLCIYLSDQVPPDTAIARTYIDFEVQNHDYGEADGALQRVVPSNVATNGFGCSDGTHSL